MFRTRTLKKKLRETYAQYVIKMKLIPKSNVDWIYNLIDGKYCADRIIYDCKSYLLIPNITWSNQNNVNDMHVLAVVKNKKLMTLRDIRSCDIPFLKEIRDNGLKVICDKYKLHPKNINIYCHYPPGTYHFHMHFEHTSICHNKFELQRQYSLNTIITNISNYEYYYCSTLFI
jgi:hypothetical protein